MLRSLAWCLGLGTAATAISVGIGAADPFAAALAGSVMGGAAGNFGHEVCKVLDRRVLGKLLEGRSSIVENHVVVQALRLAELKALGMILERFDAARMHERDAGRASEAARVSAQLTRFLSEQTKAANTLALATTGDPTPMERTLRHEVLKTLPTAFDQGLAARRMAGDKTAIAESLGQIRRIVETAVLAELRLTLFAAGEEFPVAFSALFAGTETTAGWFDLFLRDASDRIKAADGEDNGAFEKIWNAEQTALIKAITEANRTVLERLDTRTEQIEQDIKEQRVRIDELLALARSGGLIQRAAEQGISEAAVRDIVERLGGEGIGRDDLLPWLESWIAAAQRELNRVSNEGEAFETARRDAERLFRLGRAADASSPFMAAFEQEERTEKERQQERKRQRLRLLEEAIRFDQLALNGEAAVQKLRLAAAVEGITGSDALGTFLADKAVEFYARGDRLGDKAALLVAVAAYRAALKERTRHRVPLDWAETQNNLGLALWKLGERESSTARLIEAVAAYRAALQEWKRERVPLQWATAQNNLGLALWRLGERESGTGTARLAVAAYRMALKELTRKRVPLDWAMIQNNLGNALRTLGKRESGTGTARLAQAVAAYREALNEQTRERVPFDWAGTHNNLGIALFELGERESGTARLEEAVVAYRTALEEWTRERVPLQWVMTQNNLGAALASLGQRESGTARLEEAVVAYREVLKEQTRERVPFDWAGTQNNLGIALSRLGEREDGSARLEEAVVAYREALKEQTRERVPFDWAVTQHNLGIAFWRLGEREDGTARLEEAVAAYREALKEWTRQHVPLQWAATQHNLGAALASLGQRESGTARLEEAVATYREALKERTRHRVPLDWAMTQYNLGAALSALGERESGAARLVEAVAAYRAALQECTRERVPVQWAALKHNLGKVEAFLASRRKGDVHQSWIPLKNSPSDPG